MNRPAAASPDSLKTDLFRVLAIVAASAALGICNNYFGRHPVPLFAADGPGALPERAERISTTALADEIKNRILLIVDVRAPENYAQGHATGSLNAPASDFLLHYKHLNLAPKFEAVDGVVLICDDDQCPAADRVTKMLIPMGVKNVRVLHGGWDAYRQSGLPIEKTP